MPRFFDFEYRCTIKRTATGIEVVAYNSPYNKRQDWQSIDDIKYAVLVHKVFDVEKIPMGGKKDLKIKCRFIENKDGSFDQIFTVEE